MQKMRYPQGIACRCLTIIQSSDLAVAVHRCGRYRYQPCHALPRGATWCHRSPVPWFWSSFCSRLAWAPGRWDRWLRMQIVMIVGNYMGNLKKKHSNCKQHQTAIAYAMACYSYPLKTVPTPPGTAVFRQPPIFGLLCMHLTVANVNVIWQARSNRTRTTDLICTRAYVKVVRQSNAPQNHNKSKQSLGDLRNQLSTSTHGISWQLLLFLCLEYLIKHMLFLFTFLKVSVRFYRLDDLWLKTVEILLGRRPSTNEQVLQFEETSAAVVFEPQNSVYVGHVRPLGPLGQGCHWARTQQLLGVPQHPSHLAVLRCTVSSCPFAPSFWHKKMWRIVKIILKSLVPDRNI